MTIKVDWIPDTTQAPLDDEERELMDLSTLTRIARKFGVGPAELVRRTAVELIAAQATR